MMGFMTVDETSYMPIDGFTTVELGCERGNNAFFSVQKTENYENAGYFLNLFEQLWNDKKKLQEVTDVVIENIWPRTGKMRRNISISLLFTTFSTSF